MSARYPKWERKRHKQLYLTFLRLMRQGYVFEEIVEAVNHIEYNFRKGTNE